MFGSMFCLDHRVNELRPSERDHEVARQLREAASPAKIVARTFGPAARPWRAGRLGGRPSHLAAG